MSLTSYEKERKERFYVDNMYLGARKIYIEKVLDIVEDQRLAFISRKYFISEKIRKLHIDSDDYQNNRADLYNDLENFTKLENATIVALNELRNLYSELCKMESFKESFLNALKMCGRDT